MLDVLLLFNIKASPDQWKHLHTNLECDEGQPEHLHKFSVAQKVCSWVLRDPIASLFTSRAMCFYGSAPTVQDAIDRCGQLAFEQLEIRGAARASGSSDPKQGTSATSLEPPGRAVTTTPSGAPVVYEQREDMDPYEGDDRPVVVVRAWCYPRVMENAVLGCMLRQLPSPWRAGMLESGQPADETVMPERSFLELDTVKHPRYLFTLGERKYGKDIPMPGASASSSSGADHAGV